MKKFFLFAAACVALVACKNDENVLNNAPQGTPFEAGQYVTISAGMPANGNQSAARKIFADVDDEQITYTWEKGDQIVVKVGDKTATFNIVNGAGTNSATFAGTMPGSGSTFDILYPVEEPDLSVQERNSDGLPEGMMSFKATGCTLNDAAELTATKSVLRLNLTGSPIEDENMEILKIVINMVDASNKEYTLDMLDPKELYEDEPNSFCIIVDPVTSKVKVSIYDKDDVLIDCFTSPSINFVANECTDTEIKKVIVSDYFYFTALADDSNVGINTSSPFDYENFQWKMNDEEDWEDMEGSFSQDLSEGDKLYIRAKEEIEGFSTGGTNLFTISGNVKVSGNIMVLINPESSSASLSESCFSNMFEGQDGLTDASELILPATNLAFACYEDMFAECTSLVNAPTLPATTLAHNCYYAMFKGCTSLVNAPELPAHTLGYSCYNAMFEDCTSLVNAPALPAKVLVQYCYTNMFLNCSVLKSVTMLATNISDGTCLSNWLTDAGTSATSRTVYVANSAMVTAIKDWKYLDQYPAIPKDVWTVAVKP